jgi:hypothetical protein
MRLAYFVPESYEEMESAYQLQNKANKLAAELVFL